MIRLVDRADRPVSPEEVWAWFADLDEHYQDWHPEHLAWRTLGGPPLTDGTVCFADEWIGTFRLAGRFRIHHAKPPRSFRWDFLGPYALVGAGGAFTFEPTSSGCQMVAEVHFGWSLPLLGPLLDALLTRLLPLGDLRRHMAEEGTNLARLLRTSAACRSAARMYDLRVPPPAGHISH
jgi:hypothetical protein